MAVMPTSDANSAAFPSITGSAGERTDVAQTQHGRAVGHDGDGVRQVGVEARLCRVVADREANASDARRVDVAQDLGAS